MLFATSTYAGFYLSDRLKRRYDFLRGMVNALLFIRSQIEFGKYELCNIFERIDNTPALCGFFAICGKNTEQYGIQKAWQTATDTVYGIGFMKETDKEGVLQLSAELGMSDVRGQIKLLDSSVGILNNAVAEAKEEFDRMFKTYRACGILLGIFFLVLLI